VRQWVG